MDEKAGGVYFFSHRSFQEFLVAEFIWDAISEPGSTKRNKIDIIVSSLTREVFDFLIERDDRRFFRSFLLALNHCKQDITLDALAIIGTSSILREIAAQRPMAFFSAWDAAVLIANAFSNASETENFSSVTKLIIDKAAGKPTVILTAIQLLVLLGARNAYDIDRLVLPTIALLFCRTEADFATMDDETQQGARGESLKDIIFETVSAQFDNDTDLVMRLDMEELIGKISTVSNFPVWTGYLDDKHMQTYEAPFNLFFSGFSKARLSILWRFFKRDAEVAIAVQDELKVDPKYNRRKRLKRDDT